MEDKTSVAQILAEVCAQICDKYCKFPNLCECEDELIEEHCEGCPLGLLIE